MPKRRIKLTIEYDGSGYHGWQVQDNAHTVQAEIEEAIYRITGERVRITGAGRTDSGVHAFGQVAHFDTDSSIQAEKFKSALSAVLPQDVAVVFSEEVPLSFHARFQATGKTYEYRVLNRQIRSPLMENRAWNIRRSIDFCAMKEAAKYFIGTRDFSTFCATGREITDFERTIYSSEWFQDGECYVYRVRGSGFLYNMVRIMAGTMVEVGEGKKSPDSIPGIISGRNRNLAGITAPAHGLYLVKVHY